MTRRLYGYLIRLHPDHFRRRFGPEMLAIFDEGGSERGEFHLALDAFVSMVRQRMFRPQPPLLRSERMHKTRNRLNFAWMLLVLPLQLLIASLMGPTNRTMSAEVFYTLLPVFILFFLYRAFNRGSSGATEVRASIRDHGRDFRRADLQRRRDSSVMWSDYMGPVMIGSLLTWILPPAAGFFLFGQTLQFHSWAFVNFVVFAIQTLIYIGVLKGFNRRAALALREEIEALDAAGR